MQRLGLVFVLCVGLAGPAEASRVSDGVDAVWKWLTTPINCVGNWTATIVSATADAIQCALHNANPERIVP